MTENKRSGEVVLTMSGDEKDSKNTMFMPSPNRPPKLPCENLTRRKTFTRSILSRPKSRFGEQPIIDQNMFDETAEQVGQGQTSNSPIRIASNRASPRFGCNSPASPNDTPFKKTTRTVSITHIMASPRGTAEVDKERKIFEEVSKQKKLKYKRQKMKILFEWIVFLLLSGCIVSSLTVKDLKKITIWSVELWKWFVLITVIISGMLVTNWLMNFIVLLIELNYLLRKKVLYFVHGLKKSVQVCIWLIVVLITWTCLFNDQGFERSKTATKVLDYITWTIVSLLVGGILWLLKTLLLKILASSFHVSNFFDRIQEAIFLHYVLLTLSGPPVMESIQNIGACTSTSQLSFQTKEKGKGAEIKDVIDVSKLFQMKREKVSPWTMKMLVDVISSYRLSTFSEELEKSAYDRESESADNEITSEMKAIAAAYQIFTNVAQDGFTYIKKKDLRRFMIKEEVDMVFSMIAYDKGQIDRKTLTEWVVKVFNGREALVYALSDTKTVVKQLDKLVTAFLVVIIIAVWLLLTEIATTKVLVLLSSQLVVAAFIFGNTCKTIFEAIVFVFIMHPFDVGDRCCIDGVQLIVEEMNILTTVFLRYDNEKIYYPNAVLSTKAISNFNRSPDMGDCFEFSIDFATPLEKIGLLKDKLKMYLESNPQLWHENHNFVVKDIENVNKIKMALYFNHKMNFQDYGEKSKRRSELVLEAKKIFEELKIKCNLLPQDVHVHHPETLTGSTK